MAGTTLKSAWAVSLLKKSKMCFLDLDLDLDFDADADGRADISFAGEVGVGAWSALFSTAVVAGRLLVVDSGEGMVNLMMEEQPSPIQIMVGPSASTSNFPSWTSVNGVGRLFLPFQLSGRFDGF